MQLKTFLSRVLPETGSYYVVTGNNANQFRHVEQSSIDDLASAVTKRAVARNNVFFTTASCKPHKGRDKSAIEFKKSFYLDLDCGADKSFKTQRDALVAFSEFKKVSGILSPNIIVSSGNGIHLYWALQQAIPVATWLKIAELLKSTCKQLNFDADAAVTADAVRIMRAPETNNSKGVLPSKPCRVIKQIAGDYPVVDFLNSIKKWAAPKPKLPAALAGVDINDDLSINIGESNRGPKYFKYGKDECLVMQDMMGTHGADYSETAWMQAIGLLTFCEDGHEYIHEISSAHTTYDYEGTERKWRARLKGKEAEKFGPVLCKTLSNLCSEDHCSVCPHNGRVKSPITLCTPPHGDIEMPKGFSQNESGVWYRDPNDAEAVPVHICPFTVSDVERVVKRTIQDEVSTHILCTTSYNSINGVNEVKVDVNTADCYDYRKLARSMSTQTRDISSTPSRKHFGTLMTSWSELLDKSNKTIRTQSKFGWVGSGAEKRGFSVGDTTLWEDGTETPSYAADPVMSENYAAEGDLKDWQAAVQFVLKQGRGPINAVIAASFGAPLMKFTGEPGVILSLVSECSASGKTTALSAGGSVWGNPNRTAFGMDDTHNARQNKMGALGNIPMYWDEVRNLRNDREFSKQVFQICHGTEKARLNSDSTQKHQGKWETIMAATSNESLVTHVDNANPNESNAGRLRILEFEVPRVTNEQSVGAEILHNLDDNYGLAGRIYAKHLATNRVAIAKRVKAMQKAIKSKLKLGAEERYWLSGAAATIVGAQIANELDLLEFNISELVKFFGGAIKHNNDAIIEHQTTGAVTTASDVSRFMAAMEPQAICWEDMELDGTPVGGAVGSSVIERGEIAYEYGIASGRVKINKGVFKQWLKENKKNLATVIVDLKRKSKNYKDMQAVFGCEASGTFGTKIPAFVMDLNRS